MSNSSTRSRVCGATSDRPLITRETVGTETPANRAIIAMVTFLPFSEPTVTLSSGGNYGRRRLSQQVGVIP